MITIDPASVIAADITATACLTFHASDPIVDTLRQSFLNTAPIDGLLAQFGVLGRCCVTEFDLGASPEGLFVHVTIRPVL